jgi:DNA polymerase-3 subunit gamma/tau
MEYQVSARKYRPGTFRDVIGQAHIVQTLSNALSTRRLAHAFLFSGSRGVGKTTVARILAKALNCEQGPTATPCGECLNCVEITTGTSVDVIEIDGASNTGVDDVREIRENIRFAPFRGSFRVYIIDEVHMLSNSAFNALLKTLEEPPAHVVFIFATTEIHKIPSTILSRCQHYNFRRISRSEIIQRLRQVAAEDGIVVEDRSLAAIARASEGSMRDALSLLDQAVAFGGKTIRHADIETLLGAVPHELVHAMISAIIAQDSPAALRLIARVLEQGQDLKAYCGDLVEYLRHLLVATVVPEADPQVFRGLVDLSEEEIQQVRKDAAAFTTDQLQELFRIFAQVEDGLRLSTRPRFVLETGAVRATRLLRADPNLALPDPQTTGRSSGGPFAVSSENQAASGPDVGPPRHSSPPHRPRTAEQPARSALMEPSAPVEAHATETIGETAPDHPQELTLSWQQVLDRVEQLHPNIAPFLAMGTLLTIDGRQVTLGFPKAAAIGLARLQKKETLQLVTDICTECAGQPVYLRVAELTDVQAAALTLAEKRPLTQRSCQQQLLDQARSHPLVKQTLEMFGADLAEVRQTSAQKEKQ